MTAFEPGPGWREVTSGQEPGAERIIWSAAGSNAVGRVWVREEQVPALPTEEYTTIRVTWRITDEVAQDDVMTLRQMRPGPRWWNERGPHEAQWLQERITGFEVLAQPIAALVRDDEEAIQIERSRERDQVRLETAKAVLDRVRDYNEGHAAWIAERLYPEFGVSNG